MQIKRDKKKFRSLLDSSTKNDSEIKYGGIKAAIPNSNKNQGYFCLPDQHLIKPEKNPSKELTSLLSVQTHLNNFPPKSSLQTIKAKNIYCSSISLLNLRKKHGFYRNKGFNCEGYYE